MIIYEIKKEKNYGDRGGILHIADGDYVGMR